MIRRSNVLRGALIYPLGDAVGMWIHGPFCWTRMLGLALLGNYAIQNVVPRDRRFAASAIFSGLMAVYYALSAVWFG